MATQAVKQMACVADMSNPPVKLWVAEMPHLHI